MSIELTDLAKLFGGLLAFVAVIYVGIIFFRRESNFSDEYGNLIIQYKRRNEELQSQIDKDREDYKRDIAELKSKHAAEMAMLRAEIDELRLQVNTLQSIIKK